TLDYVRNQYPEQELDTQGLELDILYRLCEQEGDDYLETVEDLLKTILAKNWHESDYAAYVLYRIFSESKMVFRDEILNQWGDNLNSINPADNALIQMYLRSAGTKENTKSGQKAVKVDHEKEYLFSFYNKGKSDGYFNKYDSYDSFREYFRDDLTFKKLWDFLKSKGYKVLPFNEFILKIKEKKEPDQKVLTETVVQKNEAEEEVEPTEEDNEFLLQMAGKPTESYSDGNYRGDFQDGLRHGYGQRFWNTGDVYAGDWFNGEQHGKGYYATADGDVYDGEWNNGQKYGHGICKYADGSVYEGEWEYDVQNGNGTLTFADGGVYEGEWENGAQNGHGIHTFADGNVYDGEWEEGFPSGNGTLTRTDGGVYEGEWKNGAQHGHGIYTDADGDVYDCEWEGGVQNGDGTLTMTDGTVYAGEWKNGVQNGKGLIKYENGCSYEGNFKDGNIDGSGIFTWANGSYYDGKWKDNKRHGKGIFVDEDGNSTEQMWKNGELQ
ncbi:MAG: hypothetical protein WAW07_16555, partial [Bacteroidales bacterium]